MYSEKEIYIYTTITTGDNITDPWVSVGAKPIALKAGWNFVTIDMRYSLSEIQKDFNIANGLQELYFRTGDAGSIIKESATLYIDSVCFAALPERVVENLAIDFTNIALPGDKEFGDIKLCTDEQYTKNGKPSLMLEMTANEAENKNMLFFVGQGNNAHERRKRG